MRVLVAIDGPAGSGKSTLARGLARELGLPYINTGLMYRALTHRALAAGVAGSDGPALADLATRINFGLGGEPPGLLIDGAEPGEELQSARVEAEVSEVSRHPEVRDVMRRLQRTLGADGAVMEGRDIGTVVFPDATIKIFLVAAREERSARRIAERVGEDPDGLENFRLAVRLLAVRQAWAVTLCPRFIGHPHIVAPVPLANRLAHRRVDALAD